MSVSTHGYAYDDSRLKRAVADAEAALDGHSGDPEAHPAIRQTVEELGERLEQAPTAAQVAAAQGAAVAAQDAAGAAQTTAEEAKTAAAAAQGTADDAKSVATAAQGTAGIANTTASNAMPKGGGTFTGNVMSNNPAVGTQAVRNIYAGTGDLNAGTTNLTTGVIYFVYE